jgi:putative IMPACT (imprinted ancient) family translation regulator
MENSTPAAPDGSYATLAAPGRAEIRVERSRFLAHAVPAASEAEARERVAEVGRDCYDCRHVAFGWRGGGAEQPRELRSDGGEPAGTAGEPILAALRAAGVSDAVVVVARWFGGVKLGTGGLSRAFGQAAAAALAAAPRRIVIPGCERLLVLPYARARAIEALLSRYGGRRLSGDYAELARWLVWLPSARLEEFARAVTEATAGAVKIEAPVSGPEPRGGSEETGA